MPTKPKIRSARRVFGETVIGELSRLVSIDPRQYRRASPSAEPTSAIDGEGLRIYTGRHHAHTHAIFSRRTCYRPVDVLGRWMRTGNEAAGRADQSRQRRG